MKKLLCLLALVFAAHSAFIPAARGAVVQTVTCTATTTSLACPISAVSTGDALVAFASDINYSATATITGVSDSVNGAWTLGSECPLSGSKTESTLYYLPITAAGIPTVTVTLSASVIAAITVMEISGANAASLLDGTPTCGTWNYSATAVTSPSITTTASSDLLLASNGSAGNEGTITVASPYTMLTSGLKQSNAVAMQATSSAAPYTGASFTETYGSPSYPITVAIDTAASVGQPAATQIGIFCVGP